MSWSEDKICRAVLFSGTVLWRLLLQAHAWDLVVCLCVPGGSSAVFSVPEGLQPQVRRPPAWKRERG